VTPSVASPYLLSSQTSRRYPLGEGQSWTIGRGDGCAVLLESRSVSRLHALIQRKDTGDLALVDLGSRNGSFQNGRRVSFPVSLRDQDRLVFGDQELVFVNITEQAAATASATAKARSEPTTAMHTSSMTTILVVDIRDFTPLSRSLSESLLSQTIGTWFLRTGQIVQNEGSWAQKYIGDAVMAVWVHDNEAGIPADMARVLRALHAISDATADISSSLALPAPLRIGAGVNTGLAIIGGSDYTALGDTVNAAFRLETATKGIGLGVALGARSHAELAPDVQAAFMERQVELKGYEGPSTAWAISFESLAALVRRL
jgi:adenylate cyclase